LETELNTRAGLPRPSASADALVVSTSLETSSALARALGSVGLRCAAPLQRLPNARDARRLVEETGARVLVVDLTDNAASVVGFPADGEAPDQRGSDAEDELMERLALAAEFRDDETNEHAQRVGRAAAALAEAIGLGSGEAEILRRAAPLHDIGKIGVADSILLKPGRLRPEEHEIMKTHTLIGSQILAGSHSELLSAAEEIARTHHERWDGRGYPAGLCGLDVPLRGRITAIADTFDALSFSRPYKDAWPLDAVLTEMRLVAGRQLDPELVAVLPSLDCEALLAPVEYA
jgi:putative two-component system response regulator